jgi:hypothetical protein
MRPLRFRPRSIREAGKFPPRQSVLFATGCE